jgi:hypothetical protein
MVAAWIKTIAARKGHAPPILFEREARPDDNGTLVVDVEKVQAAFAPDPKLYRALPGGGYTYLPAEEVWQGDEAAIRRRARKTRRRARRAARKAAKATESAKPQD